MTGTEALIALTVLSTAMSAVGSVMQGQSAKAAADYNAALAEQNAKITRQQGKVAEDAKRREYQRIAGANAAAIGASGMTFEGSVIDLMASNAYDAEMDAQTVRYNYELRARGLQNEAALERSRGANAATAGYIGAASTLVSGAGSAIRMNNTPTNIGG